MCELVKQIFATSVNLLFKRHLLFTFMNALYFGSLLVATLMTRWPPALYEGGWGVDESLTKGWGLVTLFLGIFLFNLVVSGFLLLTVTGLLFFAFPVGFLVLRAALWGFLLNRVSTPVFLVAFPTLLLEGEGYVIAGVAGVILGLSWLKPSWIGKAEVSRRDTLKQALKECIYLYVLVATLLLVAGVVETLTIYLT